MRLKKPWALIRKPGDTAHSHNRIEGAISGKYVILDDFVDTGATIHAIIQAVANPYGDVNEWFRPDPLPPPVPAECVGIVLYERSWVIRTENEREYWQEKLGGLRVLSWPTQNMTQRAGVGKITFPKQIMFGGEDYTNLLNPPPMPPSLSRTYEEIAF